MGWNRRAGGIFLKINKRADQNKTVQGGIFLKINKRAGQNNAVQGGIFSQN